MKKVRSLIDDKEDMERIQELSAAALTKLKTLLWIGGDKRKRETKVKKALVKSILTYSCGACTLT